MEVLRTPSDGKASLKRIIGKKFTIARLFNPGPGFTNDTVVSWTSSMLTYEDAVIPTPAKPGTAQWLYRTINWDTTNIIVAELNENIPGPDIDEYTAPHAPVGISPSLSPGSPFSLETSKAMSCKFQAKNVICCHFDI